MISNACRRGDWRTATTSEMQGHNMCGIVERHAGCDGISPVTAMRGITRVTKARHQFDPHTCDPFRVIASLTRLTGEAETGHRWDDNMKAVFGERTDNFFVLDDRTRPSIQKQ